jgi:hypothetical protein
MWTPSHPWNGEVSFAPSSPLSRREAECIPQVLTTLRLVNSQLVVGFEEMIHRCREPYTRCGRGGWMPYGRPPHSPAVITRALLGVSQCRIRLIQASQERFGIRIIWVQIWMELGRQAMIRLLELREARISAHPQNVIVVRLPHR